MNRDQITMEQLSRTAVIYIRQSSLHQVSHNLESGRRQRNFVERALELGWNSERILVVDEDMGETASRTGQRSGFEQMITLVAVGKIGIILALEVSRLARANRDWYYLLDICAITGTLIADEEGLYDPKLYNDRLLLGLKGTMSEAELHAIKQRLVEAMRQKAKRGELRRNLPAGFIWSEAGRIEKDPDEQVTTAIHIVFQRFNALGVIHQTYLSLIEDDVRIPVRESQGQGLAWKLPSSGQVSRMLTNPVYAGAYVYGRRQTEEGIDADLKPKKRIKQVMQDNWHVLIKDHHEGYISWDQFEKNQKHIRSNCRGGPAGSGAPGKGESLLQGLIMCGRCGRLMSIAYGKDAMPARYRCDKAREQTGSPVCQAFGARRLERAVEMLLLDCLSPACIDAMVEAAKVYAQSIEVQRRQWGQKVERAHYEVNLARRQYNAVDPENRLVARELERRFEASLKALSTVEADAEKHIKEMESELSAAEELQLRRYAHDVASLWNAPTTRSQDRKRIARCLIETVVVTAHPEEPVLKAKIHWKGGEVSSIEVAKGKSGINRYVSDPELVDLVRNLAGEFSDEQIARILRRQKLKTAKGLPFAPYHVSNLRRLYGIEKGPRVPTRGKDVYTAEQAAELLGINRATVIRWVEVGLIRGSHLTDGAPWRIQLTEQDIQKLKPAEADDGWLPLKGAALALGVSQQAVLQKLKSGQLEGVRVQNGRRSSWRIRVAKDTYNPQLALF
jgi:DNA invertase Pin-like site-specific DNA recombinase